MLDVKAGGCQGKLMKLSNINPVIITFANK